MATDTPSVGCTAPLVVDAWSSHTALVASPVEPAIDRAARFSPAPGSLHAFSVSQDGDRSRRSAVLGNARSRPRAWAAPAPCRASSRTRPAACCPAPRSSSRNPVSGFKRDTVTDSQGAVHLPEPAAEHLSPAGQSAGIPDVRAKTWTSARPCRSISAAWRSRPRSAPSVEVVGKTELIERDPTAHTDIDQSLIGKLPIETVGGLNQVITLSSPGVVADSNGFFHPVGDHAQTQFSIDNQPVTDQQSRIYSNQISPDAVQAMEVITGVPPAEYGDKSSLIVHIVTKSGLDHPKPTGGVTFGYGSFSSPATDINVGAGSHTVGRFSVAERVEHRSLSRPAGIRGAARSRPQLLDLQPAGLCIRATSTRCF